MSTCRLTLVLLLLAQTSRVAAYRTFADDPDLGTFAPVAWRVPIVLDTSPELPEAARTALSEAVSVWTSAECAHFEFSIETASSAGAAEGDGRNSVVFVDGLVDDIGATTEVLLERDAHGWFLTEADVRVDASVAWQELGDSGGASLRDAFVHELGHVLGLWHPCEEDHCDERDAASALYPVQRSGGDLQLAPDDEAGLCAIYAGAAECVASCEEGACIEGVCTVACWTVRTAPRRRSAGSTTCAAPPSWSETCARWARTAAAGSA